MNNNKISILLTIVGVIAVGIFAVQNVVSANSARSVRDQARKDTLQSIKTMVLNYHTKFQTYPQKLILLSDAVAIPAEKAKNYKGEIVQLTDVSRAGTNTTEFNTAYCFSSTEQSFGLGVVLETREMFNQGNQECSGNLSLDYLVSLTVGN